MHAMTEKPFLLRRVVPEGKSAAEAKGKPQ